MSDIIKVTSLDSIPTQVDTTILDIGGGYVGSTSLPGYQGVNTVNAPDVPITAQIGNFIQQNLTLVVIGFLGIMLVGRRR